MFSGFMSDIKSLKKSSKKSSISKSSASKNGVSKIKVSKIKVSKNNNSINNSNHVASISNSKKKITNLKDALKDKFSESELNDLVTSFDSYGNIAVIEIPDSLVKKEKLIGEALLSIHKNFDTVCKITGEHSGKFRTQPVKVIAGKKSKTALYKEHGCIYKIKLGDVFFSPRLETERVRISNLIEEGEIVGAWFAGVGPYAIMFAKNSKMKKAVGIELNKKAIDLFKENIELNKIHISKIDVVWADVKRAFKFYKNYFDRIVMPLPHTGEQFLKEAVFCTKKNGFIHFYEIVDKSSMFEVPLQQIDLACGELKRKYKIVNKRIARSFSPSRCQVVIDFKLLN